MTEDGKSIGSINLNNTHVRVILNNMEDLIELCISNDEGKSNTNLPLENTMQQRW
jgi:hypothetical protein